MTKKLYQVAMTYDIYWAIHQLKENWAILSEVGDGTQVTKPSQGPKRITHQRVIELLLAHVEAVPIDPMLIYNFKFKTGVPGRPRRSELESDSQPAVSEEQLDQSEDEDSTTTEDLGIDRRGDFGVPRDRSAYPDDTRR